MIQAVLFDLDGTLLDRDQSLVSFINGQYERLSHWLSFIPKDRYIERFVQLDCRGYVWKDQVYEELISEFGISELSADFMLEDYMANFRFHCIPFDNLRDMLDSLKQQNIKLGMISNGKDPFQQNNIGALGIERDFDVLLISETEGIRKPDVQIFERALKLLGVDAENSLFIGDHPVNDVAAAKRAGMTAIWKKDAAWPEVQADYIIEDLAEIPELVSRLNG